MRVLNSRLPSLQPTDCTLFPFAPAVNGADSDLRTALSLTTLRINIRCRLSDCISKTLMLMFTTMVEMSQESERGYEHVRRYWEAWKANNGPPLDEESRRYWNGMVNIFHAVADDAGSVCDVKALAYVREAVPRWREMLKRADGWDESTRSVTLFRGVSDMEAIELRKQIARGAPVFQEATRPISYSLDKGAAIGFAGKGHIPGCVFSISVPVDWVVYCDLDCHYREGGLHKEQEVVIVAKAAIPVTVVEPRVRVHRHIFRNRASKQKWEEECARLAKIEAHSS